MSLRAIVDVFERSHATLGARLVLLTLAEFAHDDGSNAFPTVTTIARRCRMTDRGVQGALRKLEDLGEIERQSTTSRGVTVWRIVLPRGEESSPPGVKPVHQGGEAPSPDPKTEPKASSDDEAVARRDLVWEALAAVFGEPATKSERRHRGKVKSDLKPALEVALEVAGDEDTILRAYIAEIRRRRAALDRAWRGQADVTQDALVKHWTHAGQLLQPARAATVIVKCSECETGGGAHAAWCSHANEEAA